MLHNEMHFKALELLEAHLYCSLLYISFIPSMTVIIHKHLAINIALKRYIQRNNLWHTAGPC